MLISYSHQFLFIHNDKTGGSSIMKVIAPYGEPTYTRTHVPRLRRKQPLLGRLNRLGGLWRHIDFPVHSHAALFQRCLPVDVYDALFKFVFVRNPWDKLVSRYAFLQQVTDHHRNRFVKSLPNFAAFVDWEISRGPRLQSDYCCDRQGRLIVDFVGHFETLSADFAVVCSKLGIAGSLPHVNSSKHKDYRESYTPQLRDLVARKYARDIELFGYTFDSQPASKAA